MTNPLYDGGRNSRGFADMHGSLEVPLQVGKPGLAIVGSTGTVIEANERFHWLLGNTDTKGRKRLQDLLDCAMNPSLTRGLDTMTDSICPESISMEVKVHTSGGARRLDFRLARLPGKSVQREPRLLAILEEAPERKNIERLQWLGTQKAIQSRFDHDLRSRLNVILGYCAMMMEDLSEGQDVQEMQEDLQCIAMAGEDLLALNRKNSELLSLIRGTWEVNAEMVEPAEVLGDVIKELRLKFTDHVFSQDIEDGQAFADAAVLGRLVNALVFKLCQELSSGTRIRITGAPDEDAGRYRIFVSCTGVNLDEDKGKLQNLIGQTLNRTRSDTSVPNLELFYVDTLCDLLNASMEARYDVEKAQGRYMIELPAAPNYDGEQG